MVSIVSSCRIPNMKFLMSKAFCWGVLIASITWLITIALYTKISSLSVIFNSNASNEHEPNLRSRAEKQRLADEMHLNPVFPTILSEFGLIRNAEDQFIRDSGYKHHAFNALVSNNIGLFRELPDSRHKVCLKETYPEKLPVASIIMCFYNEHQMTLLRSINTVLQRTPDHLLKEILVVDDFSDLDELKEDLELQIKKLDDKGKVRLIRNIMREGLIRSRVIGARKAKGEVLVFLDSHIEVNTDWLQPLLNIVQAENSTLAVPVIDIINADTFVYKNSPLVRGGFNWGLHFKWDNLPEGTITDEASFKGPFISPTMAGGLFAVNRRYFQGIGEYDMGMNIWGGENLELSFRVWQCGGSVKILPCSRIGHVFRKRRPYNSPDGTDTMLYNSMRLATVWMDAYKDIYVKHQKVSPDFDYGDVTGRMELRKSLKCHPFSWYLKNVYPEIEIPGEKNNETSKKTMPLFQPWNLRKRKYINSYLLRLSNTTLCLAVQGSKVKGQWKRGSTLSLKPCQNDKSQLWYETDKSELVIDKLYCMEAKQATGLSYPIIGKCHEMLGDQEWRHTKRNDSPIYNTATGMCLRTKTPIVGAPVFLDLCSKEVHNSWDFV